MGFQIRDTEGRVIKMSELDKEAATFWKQQEVDPKWYAKPIPLSEFADGVRGELDHASQNSWFDTIGYRISNYDIGQPTWRDIKESIFGQYMEGAADKDQEYQIKYLQYTNEKLKPYFELIDYWAGKGYKPFKV
jgi:hypothetical protein